MGCFNTYKPKKLSLRSDLCDYKPIYSCSCKRKNLNIIQKSWNDFHNFCGKFSISFHEASSQYLQVERYSLREQLINLQKIASKIVCMACSHKFELRKCGNEIFIYKNQCCAQVEKSCLYCYQMEKKKNYSKCKKCELNLLFFPETYDKHIKCGRCCLLHCIFCKNPTTLFQNNNCKCRLSVIEKKIKFLKILIIIDLIIIILGLVLASYFEESEYYQSIKCSVKNWFSDPLCTSEQFTKDLVKFVIMMIVDSLYNLFGLAAIEMIKQLNKLSSKSKIIKTNRNFVFIGRRFQFNIN